MKKTLRNTTATKAKLAKAKASIAHFTRLKNPCSGHAQQDNILGWYQRRKRANSRIRNQTNGCLIIYENGYRGDYQPHWIKNLSCEHVYRMSLKDIVMLENKNTCPFCSGTKNLLHYGSVEAVQEHVYQLSNGNTEFVASNKLGHSSDLYSFCCNIHDCIYQVTMDKFLAHAGETNGCTHCKFEAN